MKFKIKVELLNIMTKEEGIIERECVMFQEVVENLESIHRCALIDNCIITKINVLHVYE